eukprot:6484869-Amphidinium_carterae.3
MAALAGVEALSKTRRLIAFEHSTQSDTPAYGAAEDFAGARENNNGVLLDPALAKHVSEKQ